MAILDLVTDTKKAAAPVCVKVNGSDYPLTSPHDLSVINLKSLERLGYLFVKETTDDEAAEATRLLARICRAVLTTLPDDVHAAMTDAQRFLVLQAFTTLRRDPRTASRPTGATSTRATSTSPSTGGRSRRASNGSTAAAIQKAG